MVLAGAEEIWRPALGMDSVSHLTRREPEWSVDLSTVLGAGGTSVLVELLDLVRDLVVAIGALLNQHFFAMLLWDYV